MGQTKNVRIGSSQCTGGRLPATPPPLLGRSSPPIKAALRQIVNLDQSDAVRAVAGNDGGVEARWQIGRSATLFTIFGIAAVVLSAVGLYGVMSFSVSQRTQEFGIRMALGANATRILRMVMTQGAWQLGIGLFIGVGFAALIFGMGRQALANFLFKVNTLDPWIYSSVIVLLSAVAALSCFVPARRATRVNPMEALRTE